MNGIQAETWRPVLENQRNDRKLGVPDCICRYATNGGQWKDDSLSAKTVVERRRTVARGWTTARGIPPVSEGQNPRVRRSTHYRGRDRVDRERIEERVVGVRRYEVHGRDGRSGVTIDLGHAAPECARRSGDEGDLVGEVEFSVRGQLEGGFALT